MIPPEINHAQAGLARLIQQYKSSPNFLAWLNTFFASCQALETAFQDLIYLRFLGSATADQLDKIGAIVGVARNGMSDADFTIIIQCQIQVNLSSGTIENLLSVVSPLLAAGETATIREYQPAAFILTLGSPVTTSQAQLIASLIKQARAAGVYGAVVYSGVPQSQTFTLDGGAGQGLDAGQLASIIGS
jgi:hypothetical protein